MGWAFFALYLLSRIISSNIKDGYDAHTHKPVARLLGGVIKKSRDKELQMKEAGTRASVGMLALSGMLLSGEISVNSSGYAMYQDISFLCLCGVMFWITQSIIRTQKAAYIAISVFGGLSLVFIPRIWGAITAYSGGETAYGAYFGGYLLMGVTAYVFIRALYVRHRYQEFAVAGLVASGVLFAVLALGVAHQFYPMLFLLWGVVSVAWTQSRSRSKVRRVLSSKEMHARI